MKKLFYTGLIFLYSALTCLGQEIPIPDFTEKPYYLKNGELKNIERTNANIEGKVRGMGYGGVDIFFTAPGEMSNVRFDTNNLPMFIIRLEKNIDPEEVITLVKRDKKKKRKRRRFKFKSIKMGGRNRDVSDQEVGFSVKKIQDGVYGLTFENGLEQGEYAFLPIINTHTTLILGRSVKISCFGVN